MSAAAQVEAAPSVGRRADTSRVSYMERWAERYYRSQEKIERDRLRKGKAKYRARREPLTGKVRSDGK